MNWYHNIDMIDLAHRLGLEKPRQRGKWSCPRCGSRDNLHIYPQPERGAYCYGCGSIDAPALVMAAQGCTFPQALRFIDPSQTQTRDYTAPKPKKRAMPAIDPDTVTALTWIYDHADDLSDEHQAWLAGRGIQNIAGLKTATPAYWREVASYDGSPAINSKGRPHPWWQQPFILVPYRDESGDIVDLRFRRVHEDNGPKMLSLVGERAVPVPYLGWATMGMGTNFSPDGPIWIVEGEWDALLLQCLGHLAFATPGATIWHDEWTDWLATWCIERSAFGTARRRTLIVVGDGDDAGRRMAQRVHSKLHTSGLKSFARTWSSGDAGDLHKQYKLSDEMQCILQSY